MAPVDERPLECTACETVTPHLRPSLWPALRVTYAVAVLAGLAGWLWGSIAFLVVAGAGMLSWAVRRFGLRPSWICVRCAGLRVRRVRTERPFRAWDEVFMM